VDKLWKYLLRLLRTCLLSKQFKIRIHKTIYH